MIDIRDAKNKEDYNIISDLGTIIWTKHYTPIIGSEQVIYMLNKFQSPTAIEAQIKEGYNYFILLSDERPVGYLSVIEKENTLFLSKIYVLEECRGQGIGKFGMGFVQNRAQKLSLNSISLTVNKYNTNSIKAYEKMGFENIGELVQDIGGGFVMDDYKMVKEISSSQSFS